MILVSVTLAKIPTISLGDTAYSGDLNTVLCKQDS